MAAWRSESPFVSVTIESAPVSSRIFVTSSCPSLHASHRAVLASVVHSIHIGTMLNDCLHCLYATCPIRCWTSFITINTNLSFRQYRFCYLLYLHCEVETCVAQCILQVGISLRCKQFPNDHFFPLVHSYVKRSLAIYGHTIKVHISVEKKCNYFDVTLSNSNISYRTGMIDINVSTQKTFHMMCIFCNVCCMQLNPTYPSAYKLSSLKKLCESCLE